MEWDAKTVVRLRKLWAEGHSMAEIGRRLNASKNGVVGKVHRLHLSPRPSPIRREGKRTLPAPDRYRKSIAGPTLAALGSLAVPAPRPTATVPRTLIPGRLAGASIVTATRAAAPARPIILTPAPRYSTAPKPEGRVIQCCDVEEIGSRKWRYCDKPSVAGRVYCPEHMAGRYVWVRDRRDAGYDGAAD